MSTLRKKVNFLESEEGAAAREVLKRMALDASYNTDPSYSADSEHYPDHLMSFVDKHMRYLATHPSTDPYQYLSNLRLMTKVR